MMTLAELLELSDAESVPAAGGSVIVYPRAGDADASASVWWRLVDYRVGETVSGPGLVLIPKR